MKLKGIGASSGIAIAKIFKLNATKIKISNLKTSNKNKAISKVKIAVEEAINQIKKIKDKAQSNLSKKEVAIFDAHIN